MYRFVCLIAVAFFMTTSVAESATLYMDPGVATLYRGDAITASVRIMPDSQSGECINVIDAVIKYSDNIQPVDVSVGKSIFNVWVEPPIINKEDRTITFAGGIPNGYCGRVEGDPRLTNIVAEIIFRSPGMQVGGSDGTEVKIDFGEETRVFLNDGQGTEATLVALGATYTLEKGAGASGIIDNWRESVRADDVPPEQFSIDLQKDDAGINYNGKYFIVFSTSDKQTGISHYEIMEEPVLQFSQFSWGGVGVPWIRVDQNVYVLEDQSLNSIIRVKAIDKAGNEYIATYIPEESKQTLSRNELYTYILITVMVVLFVVVLIMLIVYVRRRRRLSAESTENESEFNEAFDTNTEE